MKYLSYCFLLSFLFGCSNETTHTEIKSDSKVVEQKTIKSTEAITKYPTVIEMLHESYDFTEEDGTLKIISKNPLHIQVSKPIVKGDLESVIKEQTERDIVYVAFQSFAMTDINSIKITSVPTVAKNKYDNKYELTATINRETAKKILQKYLNTDNFQDLYELDGTIWVPNKNFSRLKFEHLESVFSDLKK